MCVYLRAKFEVSSIILTSFRKGRGAEERRGGGLIFSHSKQTSQKSAQIRANDCFSITTWSTIKDIAITSVFNKFPLFSRERLLFTLDPFENITAVSQRNGDATGAAVEQLSSTVLDEDKSWSDSAIIE